MQGGQNDRNWEGEFKRRQFLVLPRIEAGRDKAGMTWIWEGPHLNTGGIQLTIATRTAVIAIAKRCSHMLLRFTNTSCRDRNFCHFKDESQVKSFIYLLHRNMLEQKFYFHLSRGLSSR